jgi:hypothetical protein
MYAVSQIERVFIQKLILAREATIFSEHMEMDWNIMASVVVNYIGYHTNYRKSIVPLCFQKRWGDPL